MGGVIHADHCTSQLIAQGEVGNAGEKWRGQATLQLKSQVWADIVLVASKWGWKPSRPTYFFLATDFEVSAEEASSLADTIQRIWDALSADPAGFKLQPAVDISVLMNVGAFCLKGGFVLR